MSRLKCLANVFSLPFAVAGVMSFLVLFVLISGWGAVSEEVVISAGKSKSRQARKKEDYTFGSKLKRATEECSYIARNDDDSHKEELLERVKAEINNQKVVQFYEEQEMERKRSKKYYDNIEKEIRNKVFEPELPVPRPPKRMRKIPPWRKKRRFPPSPPPHRHNSPSRDPPPPPPPPPLPPSSRSSPDLPLGQPDYPFLKEHITVEYHDIFKRSPKSKDQPFNQGTFKDHNNCYSRCVFARMELVDFLGFPQEYHLRKVLEDYIDNRKIRASKINRVHKCFDEIKKVAIDDNCIYSSRIFKCMRLDEPGTWS